MRILEENWKVLTSFFPTEWQQMAWPSAAVERLRSPPMWEFCQKMHTFAGEALELESGSLAGNIGNSEVIQWALSKLEGLHRKNAKTP